MKVRGNTVGTTMPRPDWEQNNPLKADYIKNKPKTLDGTTFIPSVDADGTLSWTNNGGLDNPEPVNIKGPQGAQGIQGIQGEKGETGPVGPQGDKGDKGDTGATGADGAKGDKGDKGDPGETGATGAQGETGPAGPQGEAGVSPTVSVTDIDGGHRVTITSAGGTVSFDVMDGVDAENGNALPITGGTMTGRLINSYNAGSTGIRAAHGTANKLAGYSAARTDTGVEVNMVVQSDGASHGIYSDTLGWLIYGSGSTITCNAGAYSAFGWKKASVTFSSGAASMSATGVKTTSTVVAVRGATSMSGGNYTALGAADCNAAGTIKFGSAENTSASWVVSAWWSK